jgi:hypothetical protein
MEKTVNFQSFEDRSLAGALKTVQREIRAMGYSEEINNKVLEKFEPFYRKYSDWQIKIEIPDEKIGDSNYIRKLLNKQFHDLTGEALKDIAGLCIVIEALHKQD